MNAVRSLNWSGWARLCAAAPHTPVPFSDALEDLYIPDAQRIVNAVKTVTDYRGKG